MSMRPSSAEVVPEETARVARRAFPKGHPYLRMRDEFGVLFGNEDFAALFSHRGRPAEAPARLALVCILQYAEGLSDRQAADAVRGRVDWKYLLGLELDDAGFDASVLCEFRARLIAGAVEMTLLETLLERFHARGWLKARGRQRTDSTHVLAAARTLNRLELVGETLRHTLNVLASVAPTWLLEQVDPAWAQRYAHRCEEYRLPSSPAERQAEAMSIGTDGYRLLEAIGSETPASGWEWLREVPAVEILRQVWLQQFTREAAPASTPEAVGRGWVVRWREVAELPPIALAITSPYDREARWGRKGERSWCGYKVHLTETCGEDAPALITDVQVTPAQVADIDVLPAIQEALDERKLCPSLQVADGGYIDAQGLAESQERFGIELCGPPHPNRQWQAREGTGFTSADFAIDWEQQRATCPAGQQSRTWNENLDRYGSHQIHIGFAQRVCQSCDRRPQCTRSQQGRVLAVRPQAHHEALQAARQREGTETFRKEYALRAGIEGSISQGVRRCALRYCRYFGQAKTRLQQILCAASLNFVRAAAWLMQTPIERTRQSAFTRLVLQPT